MPFTSLPNMAFNWPNDPSLEERVTDLFRKGGEYDFGRLVQLVHPASQDELRLLLGALVRSGQLHLVFRVESPTRHGGIEDFSSIDEIPEHIDDWRAGGQRIDVNHENLRVLYEARYDGR